LPREPTIPRQRTVSVPLTEEEYSHLERCRGGATRPTFLQSKAFDLAEKQLDSGNASSQIISMLIKGGGVREQLELERLRNENRLLNARIDGLESAVRLEGLMEEALNAFRSYTGESSEEDFD
jgi:hypothetical protein